ncbi:hypothetical protein HAX54_010745, partial [Datura stramonium]|nr:hypothetical protein [Datura stramonium]
MKGAEQEIEKSGEQGSSRPQTNTLVGAVQSNREYEEDPSYESGEGNTPIQPELSTSEEKEVEVAHNSTSECSATLGDKHEQGLEDLASNKANSPNKTLHEIAS